MIEHLAVVAIGRNEGQRLALCLQSVIDSVPLVVYVDSGSTDGSAELASALGARVVELDTSIPFTAARARNFGYREVLRLSPGTKWIQFIDGDCQILSGWLDEAVTALQEDPSLAAVCGWRRERHPERSVYNELCETEWKVPAGPARYFGGDVMLRSEALVQVEGYLDSLIAGEEPELAVRLRRAGWALRVLPRDMTLHDANMMHFGQWWRRMKRSGYAYAAGAYLHGRSPERHWVWRTAQAWIWVPAPILATAMAATLFGWWALAVLLVYPLQVLRLFARATGSVRQRALAAVSQTFVRFPEFQGQTRFLADVLSRRAPILIEYK